MHATGEMYKHSAASRIKWGAHHQTELISFPCIPYLCNKLLMFSVVSDLHGELKHSESEEPPIIPQKVQRPDPVIAFAEAKLYQKLSAKLKGTLVHLMYLGKHKRHALIYYSLMLISSMRYNVWFFGPGF